MPEYKINGKNFVFNNHIVSNDRLRQSFDQLAQKSFDISFTDWHSKGYWGEKFIPYSLVDEDRGEVAANVSVSIMDTLWQGNSKRYIQIGTVMTDNAYRHKGLSKILIHKVLEDWTDKSDAIYLYANNTVLDFYPLFGFAPAQEYQSCMPITPNSGKARKLDMTNAADINLLHAYYQKPNPFSELPMLHNWGLLMFYCSTFMKDCVYYVEEHQAIVIATQNNETLTCYAIYADQDIPLAEVLSIVAYEGCHNVTFAFALKCATEESLSLLQGGDETLFLLTGKENIFKDHKTMFPLIARA